MRYIISPAITGRWIVLSELVINVLASVILLGFGYLGGMLRERKAQQGKHLEEYEFYPFILDENKVLHLDPEKFTEGVRHLLAHRDDFAARQLILIGEQNDVTHMLPPEDRATYRRLYKKIGGDDIIDDNAKFLGNYKRIVRLIGDSFPDTGIEVLLHNLTNPARALYHIKNNVTGRNIEAPATNLVLDLKTRGLQNQDKLNYELNIGARKFKCTTIPIYREDYGLVGAICINVDVRYLQDDVLANRDHLEAFMAAMCKTDMVLDENILSKAEYEKALAGKRHFRDLATM
jgi:predicted transcriptional regulator YheO